MLGPWSLGLFMVAVPYSFLYGVVSRLPMIYAMVHMLYYLELTGMVPACLFAAYCIGRLLGAIFTSSFFSMATMVIGTLTGLVAHAGILLNMDSPVVFGAMVFLSGFTETVTGIDVIMKLECLVEDIDPEDEQRLFRCHFVSVTAGAVGAYIGGGTVYDLVGIQGICWIGVGCSALQVVILAIYGWPRRRFYKKLFPTAEDLLRELEGQNSLAWEEDSEDGIDDANPSDVVEDPDHRGSLASAESRQSGASRRSAEKHCGSTGSMVDSKSSQGIGKTKSRRSNLITNLRSSFGDEEDLVDIVNANLRTNSLVTAVTGRRASDARGMDLCASMGDPLGLNEVIALASCRDENNVEDGVMNSMSSALSAKKTASSAGTPSGAVSFAPSERGSIGSARGSGFEMPRVISQTSRKDLAKARFEGKKAAIASQKVAREQQSRKVSTFYAVMSPRDKVKTTVAGWSLVISYFVTAFPIGQNFALMPLYWKVQWGKTTTVAGLIMSMGEVLGLAVLVPLATKRIMQLPIFRPFRKPMNLVTSTLTSSAMVLLVVYPNMWVSGFGCVSVHIVNVLLHTFCNEIAAAWIPADVYAKWVGRCYVAKRLSNTTMAFVCTSIFTYVSVTASFKIIGGIVGVWSFVLLYIYYKCELLPWQRKDPSILTPEEEIADLKCQVANLLHIVETANSAIASLEQRFEGALMSGSSPKWCAPSQEQDGDKCQFTI